MLKGSVTDNLLRDEDWIVWTTRAQIRSWIYHFHKVHLLPLERVPASSLSTVLALNPISIPTTEPSEHEKVASIGFTKMYFIRLFVE